MFVFDYLAQNPGVFLAVVFIFGLLIGSFLNVVIHRLPTMLEREWRDQCTEYFDELKIPEKEEPYDLIRPRSRCPHCQHEIRAWENIPVISYLIQKGRCTSCGTRISFRYPVVELLTAILFTACALHFGFSLQTAAALILTASLIALSFIDYDHHLLPDVITLPILWLGLILSTGSVYAPLHDAVIGAAVGYLVLWGLYQIHYRLTGKQGMGHGDFKLLALFGAWLGWTMLPLIVLLSSFVGALIGISLILFRGQDKNRPIPFGPFLAIAGWVALIWGHDLNQLYLDWARVPV